MYDRLRCRTNRFEIGYQANYDLVVLFFLLVCNDATLKRWLNYVVLYSLEMSQ